MKAITRGSLASLFLLAGCGTVPKFPNEYSVSVADVVRNVRCELQKAAEEAPFVTLSPGWSAGIDLTLKVVVDAGGSAGASLRAPVSSGNVVVSGNITYSESASREASLSYVQDLAHPDEIRCTKATPETHVRLLGTLGVRQWIQNLQSTINPTEVNLKKFTYSVEFTIEKTGGLGPTFSMIPFRRNVIGADFGLSSGRKDTHTLLLTFGKNPEPKVVVKIEKVKDKKGKVIERPVRIQLPSATDVPQILQDLDYLKLQNSFQRR